MGGKRTKRTHAKGKKTHTRGELALAEREATTARRQGQGQGTENTDEERTVEERIEHNPDLGPLCQCTWCRYWTAIPTEQFETTSAVFTLQPEDTTQNKKTRLSEP